MDRISAAVRTYRQEGLGTTLVKIYYYIYNSLQAQISVLTDSLIRSSIILCRWLVPQNPELVLFGTQEVTRDDEGNVKVVFKYINSEENITPIWVTQSGTTYKELNSEQVPVVNACSALGIYMLIRCSLAVVTHAKGDVGISQSAVPNCITFIQLGHANSVTAREHNSESQLESLRRKHLTPINYWTFKSEFAKKLRLRKLGLGGCSMTEIEEKYDIKLKVTGFPRNDMLDEPTEKMKSRWDDYICEDENNYNLVLLYAPTRHCTISDSCVDFFPFDDFNSDRLNNFLEEKNVLVLLKPHPRIVYDSSTGGKQGHVRVMDSLFELCQESEYMKLATNEKLGSATEILPFVDVLMTDYSAIYHQFLLLDRPMLFIPYDYESLVDTRGTTYDYHEYLPGEKINTFDQFENSITNILYGRDNYQTERRELRNKMHEYADNRSRHRVTQLIKSEL